MADFYKIDKSLLLTSVGVVYKGAGKKRTWLLVKQSEDSGWELPNVITRRAESSARAALRMLGEMGGMTAQVLEEIGRSGGVTKVGKKVVPQRHIFYLLKHISSDGEPVGFEDASWQAYAKAVRTLATKREQTMLRDAQKVLAKWEKEEAVRVKEETERERLKEEIAGE